MIDVRQDPTDSSRKNPRLVLVDAGMVAQLVPEEQEAFIGLLQCMGKGDGAAAARYTASTHFVSGVDTASRQWLTAAGQSFVTDQHSATGSCSRAVRVCMCVQCGTCSSVDLLFS
jgi:predicted unusual protein kinase regulating ubiquinone biosynthesis (AarF/ABC1/UbiB family)